MLVKPSHFAEFAILYPGYPISSLYPLTVHGTAGSTRIFSSDSWSRLGRRLGQASVADRVFHQQQRGRRQGGPARIFRKVMEVNGKSMGNPWELLVK